MKKHLQAAILMVLFSATSTFAQKIDSIYIHLYTDSLKKGTYNYINVDGLLKDGSYLPLDSSTIIFKCSAGKFYGNSLFVEPDFKGEKITINVTSRQNKALHKEFDMYIKTKPDEQLKTVDEILNGKGSSKRRKRS